MMEMTTIQLDKKTAHSLQQAKEHPRETYNEVIGRMIQTYKSAKRRNQYDEFLHKVQQPKMQEIWDNKQDEEWEHA
jgi:hypothetical protein